MSANILVIDGQGGQLGSQIVKALLQNFPEVRITAVGTNAIATAAMMKAGAAKAATGSRHTTRARAKIMDKMRFIAVPPVLPCQFTVIPGLSEDGPVPAPGWR